MANIRVSCPDILAPMVFGGGDMSVTEPPTTPTEDPPTAPAAPPRTSGTPARAGVSVFVAAAATAGWAALVSFVPLLVLVVVGWLVDGRGASSAVTALRFAGAGWLAGHAVPVDTAIGPFGLTPMALTVLVVWRLVRAGAHTARAVGGDRRTALSGALGVALGYGVLAAVVALLVSAPGITVSPLRAFLTAGLIALVSAVAGAVRENGMAAHVAGQFSPAVRAGLRGGLFATLALLAVGALAAGAAVAWHADTAAETLRAYHAGPVGDIGITLLCLVYAPTVSVWAVSYLAGPGFAVGVGTSVGIADVHLGPLPAVPVLAGLPTQAAPAAGALLLGLPLAVGVGTGWLTARRDTGTGLTPLLLATALAGAVAGALTAVAGALSAGSLGGGRLAEVGPTWWQLGLAVAGLIGVGAMVAGIAVRLLAAGTPRRRGPDA